jgi:hypothetical protein
MHCLLLKRKGLAASAGGAEDESLHSAPEPLQFAVLQNAMVGAAV